MYKYMKSVVLGTVMLYFGVMGIAVASPGNAGIKNAAFTETESGKNLTADQLAVKLQEYNVIFFGEFHDQREIHEAEIALLKALYKIRGDKLVLSMEMFEADNQAKLNEFLADKIDETTFLDLSRPWSNYKIDYAPLVNFAKEHKIPVLAANVPRFLAAHVAKNNASLDGIDDQDKQWLPKNTYVLEGDYKEKFYNQMSSPDTPMKMTPQRLAAVYAAQCLKDNKMAESMAAFYDEDNEGQMLHINGCFHSDGHLGTAQKLEFLRPDLKVAVITPMERKDADKKAAGEFIVWFDRK